MQIRSASPYVIKGPRHSRATQLKTCTQMQVGCLHPVSSLPTSKYSEELREACDPPDEGTSRLRDVGFKKVVTRQGREYLQKITGRPR